ncbi:TniQ family protein [Pseudomonas chlororaphis]|uniref:TniQ family protein n=1 Tax=Pseudomonas chlororaphis TaxID=587753 RepID=UPI000F5748F2|nr:TniQ family protein [Pseudomonas chlororaphis]MBP5068625.1 hypothetical protein [Pseudomonas chlororaphis]
MLLTIQPHESLRSFLERHFFLDSRSPESISFKEISRYYMRGESITFIADVLGRSDTYGFNRLLHDHTSYSQVAVFPDSNQNSYTRWRYQTCTTRFETESQHPGICIDCVKEDIDSLGFPYWRRDHRYVKVCAKHNTVLLRKCPVCGVDVSRHSLGYGHDLLWKGCKGRYIHQYESKKNHDEEQLLFARIFAEIGESKIAVDLECVLAHLADEAITLSAAGQISEEKLNSIYWGLDKSRRISDKNTNYRPDVMYSRDIIGVIATVHGSFAGLLDSLRRKGGLVRKVDDLMRVEYLHSF